MIRPITREPKAESVTGRFSARQRNANFRFALSACESDIESEGVGGESDPVVRFAVSEAVGGGDEGATSPRERPDAPCLPAPLASRCRQRLR